MEKLNEQIKGMLKELAGNEVSTESNLKVACWVTGGKGYETYEIHSDDRFAGFVNVKDLREQKIVKRIDHTRKVNEWLNTDEGRAWFNKNRRFKL